MLNFRNERAPDPKDPRGQARPGAAAPSTAPAAKPFAANPTPTPAPTSMPMPSTSAAAAPAASAPTSADAAESKLSIGVNINVKGVEISNCDVLVIEGNVEATINSKVMEISQPGRLNGTAIIDVAEVHGEFSGELTARTRLVVHATGRVTGTIHYGKLVVAEGGSLTGELKQMKGPETAAAATTSSTQSGATSTPASGNAATPLRDASPLLSPQPR